MTLSNPVTGTALPLIQAPMAGSQGAALAEAVFRAGALGSLPAAMLSPQGLADELRRLQAASQVASQLASHAGGLLPFNINFFCHQAPAPSESRWANWRAALAPYAVEWGVELPAAPVAGSRQPFDASMAEVLEIYRPAAVSFHFGLPSPALLERVRSWGARVLSSATTVEEALWLQAQGVDAVIAQGLEAGGHRGMFLTENLDTQLGTLALLPQVVRAVRVPVVAAGGIADAACVRAAMALGASAVQVGTAFLGCSEATTSAVHRQALLRAQSQEVHTALTNLFSGRPARGLLNRLMRELGPISPLAPEFPLAAGVLQPLRQKAEAASREDFSPLWCGQTPPRMMNRPAADIVSDLMGLMPTHL